MRSVKEKVYAMQYDENVENIFSLASKELKNWPEVVKQEKFPVYADYLGNYIKLRDTMGVNDHFVNVLLQTLHDKQVANITITPELVRHEIEQAITAYYEATSIHYSIAEQRNRENNIPFRITNTIKKFSLDQTSLLNAEITDIGYQLPSSNTDRVLKLPGGVLNATKYIKDLADQEWEAIKYSVLKLSNNADGTGKLEIERANNSGHIVIEFDANGKVKEAYLEDRQHEQRFNLNTDVFEPKFAFTPKEKMYAQQKDEEDQQLYFK